MYNYLMNELQPIENERPSHLFKPGVSGNPSGRPKSDATIRELAREHTETALQTLAEIMQNEKAPHSARVHAACALLDRGWGKPTMHVESLTVGATFEDLLKLGYEANKNYTPPVQPSYMFENLEGLDVV